MGIAREVKAVIRQSKLDDVMSELRRIPGLPRVTVSLVRGYDLSAPQAVPDPVPMYKIELVVPAGMADAVVEAVLGAGSTGRSGDGTVSVSDVGEVADLRTKSRGPSALKGE